VRDRLRVRGQAYAGGIRTRQDRCRLGEGHRETLEQTKEGRSCSTL